MTFKIRERHFIRSKTIKKLRETIKMKFYLDPDLLIPKNSQVELIKSEEINLYLVDKQVMFIKFKDALLPSIQAMIKEIIFLPKVTVDKGAIPYVTKGAHVMVPGISEVDPKVKKGDYVVIVDETHEKPIAIGITLMDSDKIKSSNKGKAILNLHYVGDKIWNFIKQLE